MFTAQEIRSYYANGFFHVPDCWSLSRKHFRIETHSHKFVKLNKFENRLNVNELRKYLVAYAPLHVYMSVLNWLFPERVGKKYKTSRAVPLNGEFVVDVDAYLANKFHTHIRDPLWNVCHSCLTISKFLTVNLCEKIEQNYSDVEIVFSGKRGFHVHVLDFNYRDWTKPNERKPIRSHASARFKYARLLKLETCVFDRAHFILSVDPMRIVTVPYSLNGETGLVCIRLGDRKDLEKMPVQRIVESSKSTKYVYGYPELKRAMKSHA